MNKPLDHETIAKAMKKAAWVAKHGTREERSGRFISTKGEKVTKVAKNPRKAK